MEYWLLLHLFIICNDCWGAMAWIIESCCSPSFPTSLLLLQRILHHWGINVPRLHLWSPLPFILWLWLDALPSDLSSSSSWLFCLLPLLLLSGPHLPPAYIVAALTRRHGQLPVDYGKPACSENLNLTSSCGTSYSVPVPTVVGANSWRMPEYLLSLYTVDVPHSALDDTDLATLQIESWGPL